MQCEESRPRGSGRANKSPRQGLWRAALPAASLTSADRMRVNCSPFTSASRIHEVGLLLITGGGGEREKAWGGNPALAAATDDLQSKVLLQGCISHREIQIHVF